MPLSWNEIKSRTISFVNEWKDETSEKAEAQTFQNEFLNIFGISRRRVASFEKKVTKANEGTGFIDLFWKGLLLIEMKSTGKDLGAAFKQATDYFHGLKEHELPKYVLVSDFQQFRLYDLDEDKEYSFPLTDLLQHIQLFGFIAGYQKRKFADESPVNIKAAYRMGKLHDRLEEVGYTGHALEVYLVRILFCLFAEDTSIFERGTFQEYIDLHTKPDGSDLAMHLAQLFQVLNTPKDKRLSNLPESLNQFEYVNGHLFEEHLPLAAFDTEMRETILECCALDWSLISPAIFGSMFQAAMNPKERRDLGAHYTSEKNIQKLIKPLFLDELHEEFEKVKGNTKKLKLLHQKIANLKFLDPACGCGNFLIITYRELRELEIKVLRALYNTGQGFLNVGDIIQVDVDQFYGIEYDEFPARIAEVAMWLMDHQMNLRVSEEFGQYFVRLPLSKSATIINGNALRIEWETVVSKNELSYILGNPPFYGYSLQTKEQKEDMKIVFAGVKGAGVMDYVSAWYIKASSYVQGTEIETAFVSTNSISQGEQVGVLWKELIYRFKVSITFAHRTFRWDNEAKGKAAVHVVIIGFSLKNKFNKFLFEYEDIRREPLLLSVKNINPYLVEGANILIETRTKPICQVPEMRKGSQPTDGGNLLFTDKEKIEFLKIEPLAQTFIKPFISAREFLNGQKRWCLWLKGISPQELKKMPKVLERIELVKKMRLESKKAATRKWADFPYLFTEDRQPDTNYILVPSHSSENRKYVPFGFFSKSDILNNSCFSIPNGNLFYFGIISSIMHVAWVKQTCGRIKSDFRYSNKIVYNNYPFPKTPSNKNIEKVEKAAQKVVDIRAKYFDSSLADLYDPLTMPPDLVKAHQKLDRAVDLCYRPQPFTNERNRIEFLFELYEEYTKPLLKAEKKSKK